MIDVFFTGYFEIILSLTFQSQLHVKQEYLKVSFVHTIIEGFVLKRTATNAGFCSRNYLVTTQKSLPIKVILSTRSVMLLSGIVAVFFLDYFEIILINNL